MKIGKEGSLAKRGKGRQLGEERERKAVHLMYIFCVQCYMGKIAL